MMRVNIDAETAAALAGAQAVVQSGEARGLTPTEALQEFAKLHPPGPTVNAVPVDVQGSLVAMTTALGDASKIAVELIASVQSAIDAVPTASDADLARFIESFNQCSSMVKLSADEAGHWLQRLTKIADAFAQS